MTTTKTTLSLPRAFVEFYLELERQRERVAAGDFSEQPTESSGQTSPTDDPRAVLRALFKLQSAVASKEGKAVELREAQYAMAVQADEVFTGMSWPGRDAWQTRSLEQELFQSNGGGEQIYTKIDALLAEPAGSRPEPAMVYLLLLSVGFRGRYVGAEETTHIEAYRRALYAWIYGKEADESPDRVRLFPEAYAHTRDDQPRTWLPGLSGWAVALAAILTMLLVASQLIWNGATAGLEEILGRLGQGG